MSASSARLPQPQETGKYPPFAKPNAPTARQAAIPRGTPAYVSQRASGARTAGTRGRAAMTSTISVTG